MKTKGFSFIQPIILIAIFSLVGLVGYYVWATSQESKNHTSDKSTGSTNSYSSTDPIDLENMVNDLRSANYNEPKFNIEKGPSLEARVYLSSATDEIIEFTGQDKAIEFTTVLVGVEERSTEEGVYDSSALDNAISQVGGRYIQYLSDRGFEFYSGAEAISYDNAHKMLRRGDTYCYISHYVSGDMQSVHEAGCLDINQEDFNSELDRIKPFYAALRVAYEDYGGVVVVSEATKVGEYELTRASVGDIQEDNGYFYVNGGARESFYRKSGSEKWIVGPGGGHAPDVCKNYDLPEEQVVYAEDSCREDDILAEPITTVSEYWQNN